MLAIKMQKLTGLAIDEVEYSNASNQSISSM